ncbi:MAG: DNA mismatch repair endonuclease MutL [Desulfobulbaceae bacterium]|nr:DNA mismatch repair endonuclease MutL [Desulfobulbaceae bacterium]
MSQIRILAENLANQIAAGEVVERPASVVKELLENALDAGASHISVQVEGAGTRLLRVIDNGCGMDPDDALLCLERHATSKLRNVDDLVHLQTLGFRGEAIPSIASVSRLTLTSRPAGATFGCRVDVRFGSVLKVHEMGCSQGTVVEVADLFANVPARRKFLKSANTELAHIDEVVRSYALVSFQTGFTYQVNGREMLDLPAGEESAERRIKQVLGADGLIPLVPDEAAARTDIEVSGYLLPPDQVGGRAGRLWTFVNGRYVKDRMVNHAVAEGLQGFLMRGGRTAGVLFIRLPPEGVDVNVHPTKQEVRFSESNLIHNKIVAAVWRSMEAYQEQVKAQIFGPPKAEAVAPAASPTVGANVRPEAKSTPLFELREPEPQALPISGGRRSADCLRREQVPAPFSAETGSAFRIEERTEPPSPESSSPDPEESDFESSMPQEAVPPRYLGQLLDSYILCQVEDGLVAIDQHAVQERLIFEELRQYYDANSMPSQILMFPEMVELTPPEVQALEHYQDEIQRLGLELQNFGGDTVLIKAIPAGLSHLPAIDILDGILSRFVDEQLPAHGAAKLHDVLAGMACKAAIKAGHTLTPLEAQHLLERMQRAGIFSHCPHGRPVVKRFSRYDIERWFQR